MLAATHILAYFLLKNLVHYSLTEFYFPNYWPVFSFLQLSRPVSALFVNFYFALYLGVSIICLFLFLKNKTSILSAWLLLIFLTLMKFFINIQDYNLMGNYHYVSLLVSLVYLFFPAKKQNIPLAIVMIYFSAGLLKTNWEWISGSALFSTLTAPNSLIIVLCSYVLLLELIFSWALLYSRKLFWFFFIQFIGFHIFSWKFVGAYYPITMFLMLSFFILNYLFNDSEEFTFKKKSSWFLVTAVLILQFVPLFFPGESRLTGEGRYFSLNMFDSLPICEVKIVGIKNGKQVDVPFVISHGARMVCDPLVFYNYTKALCAKNHFESIRLNLKSRMTSEGKFKLIIDESNFCSDDIRYSVFKHNHWIRYNAL